MENQEMEVEKTQSEINFEKVLVEFNSDNKMSAHGMIKKLSETASWEDKLNFAEYILFVETKYKDSFLEDFALEYVVSGTDEENKSASELLIRYVLKEKLSFDILEKAIGACQKIIEALPEEEDNSKYVQWLERLIQQRSPEPAQQEPVQQELVQEVPSAPMPAVEEKAIEQPVVKIPVVYTQKDKVASILYVVSSVLWVVAFVYLLIDIHSDVWATSAALHWIPSLPLGVSIGIPLYGEYLGASGIFAMILGIVASALTSTGKWCNYLKYAEVVRVVTDILCAFTVILHMYLQHWKRLSMFENVVEYLAMLGIVILIGSIIGSFVRKALKWDIVKNAQ